MSGNAINAEWKDARSPDQNLLRGAKAIADKVDFGSILLPVTDQDRAALKPILESGLFAMPGAKNYLYTKIEGGAYKGIFLWCTSDLGTCRVNPVFATSYSYDMENIKDLRISVKK